jgi:hypothetical protein
MYRELNKTLTPFETKSKLMQREVLQYGVSRGDNLRINNVYYLFIILNEPNC